MKSREIINSAQIRAGRGVLNWSQQELATAASISITTLRKLEAGKISVRHETLKSIRDTLESAGLEFMEPDGVRRKPEGIHIYEGIDGVDAFISDIRQTIRRKGGDVLAIAAPNSKYELNIYETLALVDQALKIKCLCIENPEPLSAKMQLECRTVSKSSLGPFPYYIYGDKCAVITSGMTAPDPRVIVIRSVATVQDARTQFQAIWERATPHRSSQNRLA